ncbi:MAG: hypothetical protein E6892_00555, partial [Streptococcus mitis]|nr:hypothetical protein [Streptococcus mitis]
LNHVLSFMSLHQINQKANTDNISRRKKLILFENQIQTTSASPCRTQVQPAASFLVCFLIFIEYKIQLNKKQLLKVVFSFYI